MPSITVQFKKIQQEHRIGLMTHIVLGYPSFEENIATVKLMEEQGVDFVELQLPFSDPVADGPTMMKANTLSLAAGTTIEGCFETAKKIAEVVNVPLLFMTYANIAYQYGMKRFVQDAGTLGISGIILPDLPFEEADDYVADCREAGIDPIFVVSPNTREERLRQLKNSTSGMVYCTTRTGITGVQATLPPDTKEYLSMVRDVTQLPLAVGFGISTKAHLDALRGSADCAVIGSAIMQLVHDGKSSQERLQSIAAFLAALH